MEYIILFTEMNYDANNEWLRGESDSIEDPTVENLLEKIRERYYPPNNDIKLKVSDNDIKDWLRMIKRKVEDIDFDDEKYLQLAFIPHEDGFDEFELEFHIEGE